MSKRDKLIAKIWGQPPSARFSDVRALLEDFGWTFNRQSGSHAIFVKRGEGLQSIPIDGGQRVKGTYLKDIYERLGLDD